MQKGFTLIELLIVIAIVAILAAAVVVVLNPGQLLAQARDGQRIADLDSLRNAVSLMLATATTTTGYFNASTTCMVDNDGGGTTTGTSPFATTSTCAINTSTGVTGLGWVTVNFNAVSGGSPLAALPTDPTNDATYHYAWTNDVTNLTFETNARLESQKHRVKMTTDGGDDNTCNTFTESTCFYEIGNDPGLNL